MNRIKLYWSIISPNLYLGALGLLIFIGTGLVLSIPLWLLWNWLMPYIFGLPTLNIIQMFGLSILITLLSPKEIKFGNKATVNIKDTTNDINDKLEKNKSSNKFDFFELDNLNTKSDFIRARAE